MANIDYYMQLESYIKQQHAEIQHNMALKLLEIEQQYKRFAILKPKITKDGNEWCVLYGEDLQSGIAGFGNTPHEAVMDWERQWNKN
jgi:hypothetical protein